MAVSATTHALTSVMRADALRKIFTARDSLAPVDRAVNR
jgi:hypothetical protein